MKKGDKIQVFDCAGHVAEHKNKIAYVNSVQDGKMHAWIDDGSPAGSMSCWPTDYIVVDVE